MPETSAFNIPSSPIAATGTVVLLLAFLVAGYAAATGILGTAQRRRALVTSSIYGLYGFFALMTLASALMVYAFVTHDYTIKYVALNSDTQMPLAYKISAYWGGLDGSLMFWVAVLAAFSAVAVWSNRHRHRDMIGYVVATIMVVQLFFLALLIYSKNPFATTLTEPPIDGQGLNPLLQNYWMMIHPPMMYIGFVAATVPFAFCVAALAAGRLDDLWLASVRSWTLICFLFLSIGNMLGGRWAYEELGWGGYWAWDPVENAGLLPWFTATAFLHSVMIQEQRGMMKVWNVVLVVMTFFLTIFGTFMTRSGVVQSVHAFGEDNELALLFILFMALILIISFGLLVFRLPKLRSSSTFESFISREYAFLLNNWILLACAFFVLFATMFPTISEALDGERITVGPEFFNKWMTPLGLVLLLLAGAAPLLAWRRTTRDRLYSQFLAPLVSAVLVTAALALIWPRTMTLTSIFAEEIRLPVALINFAICAFVGGAIIQEYYKGVKVRMRQTGSGPGTSLSGLVLSKRRKYGGYIVHLAVAVMFVGFAGKAWETMEDLTVTGPGESFQVREYRFEYHDLIITADDHKRAVTADVSLYDDKGRLIKRLDPAIWDFAKSKQKTTEVSISHHFEHDVYLILTGFQEQGKVANFRVYINPLVNWVWFGCGLLIFGVFICLIPQRMVDSLSPRRKTRAGRATEAAIIVLILGGVTFGLTHVASAQAPPRAQAAPMMEHEEVQYSRAGHDDGGAHICRPAEAGEDGVELATKLTRELICMCGCTRENLYDCKCGFAAEERCKVLAMLADHDLSTSQGKRQAYDAVINAFVAEYEGQHVLATPRNKLTWLIPYAAIAGGLLLLYGFGRRWTRRGRQHFSDETADMPDAAQPDPEDEEQYAEMLDDELRDTD